MKTLTVHEASQSLGDWLRRAACGEQIAIQEGNCTVLLQPLAQTLSAGNAKRLPARDALRELQAQSNLASAEAEKYLAELRDERLSDGGPNRQ